VIWGRRAAGAEAEQGLKGRRRCSATVVPECKLVQVDRELRATDAMVGSDEPLLKIADRTVRQWHGRCGALAERAAQRLRARDMCEAGDGKPVNCFRPSV